MTLKDATKNAVEVENRINSFLADVESSDFNLDNLLRITQPSGSFAKALGSSLYGIDHRQLGSFVPVDKNNTGLVFFTRPQLAMTSANLLNSSAFANLATTNRLSMFRYVRNLLDPRCSTPAIKEGAGENPVEGSPYLMHELIFAPCLTNSLESLSGWPDPSLPTFTSKENLRGGQWKVADGLMHTYGSFDISCTFKNYVGNPLFSIFYYWIKYISCVVDGVMKPYNDMLAANEIDYNTRIYRLVLDDQMKYVKMIACTGASFPISIDIGKFFNYNRTNESVIDHKEISVTFTSVGACYLENIIVDEFNKAVCIGKPAMWTVRNTRLISDDDSSIPSNFEMEKIPQALLRFFNFRGYPFINTNTLELEWWIDKSSPTYSYFKNMIGNKIEPKPVSVPMKTEPEQKAEEDSWKETEEQEAARRKAAIDKINAQMAAWGDEMKKD